MNYTKRIFIICCYTGFLSAQETLTKTAAVALTLEHNYGILLANNTTKIAANNTSIYNTGYLPTLTGNGNATYTRNNSDLELQNGKNTTINNADSKNFGISIGLNYVLFDGFGRSYNFKKLQHTHHLSKLETKAVIERTIIQLFNKYYLVAELAQSKDLIETSLNISKTRLKREKYMYDYGQSTKLDLLNAEVDVNNDRIKLLNSIQLLNNSKREINLILGRNVATKFNVDPHVTFDLVFNLSSLIESSKLQNIAVQQLEKNIKIAALNIKINTATSVPSLHFNSSYKWNKTANDPTYTFANQTVKGINAGVNLRWNIFDGGRTKTRVANSKILAENLKLKESLLANEIELFVRNVFTQYQNALIIIDAEKKNVETNNHNFNRTNEQYKLGQITSIVFRQAQVNLINAQTNLNKATYAAKIAALNLLQLSGALLESSF